MSARRDRYRQVVETLTRHGLGFLLGRPGRLPAARDAADHAAWLHSRPEHVRLAIEELGTTFIKLGQIVSTRADLLPPEYAAELARLQDAAPPVAAEEIRSVVRDELGRDLERVFDSFDDAPIASASIGQAHAAVLGGADVVVKVRRPGVVEEVALDLEILQHLALLVSRAWPAAGEYDLPGLVEEFSATLRAELDYLREAENVAYFADAFAGDPRVHIPAVHWAATTPRVLTLDAVTGIKISDAAALDRAGVDRHAVAVAATGLLCEMVFEEGVFHADPHPGNFFIEAGGRIGLIDFGMVGRLDERLREQLVRLALAVSRRDADRAASALLAMCTGAGPVDRERLAADLSALIARYAHRTVGEVPMGPLAADVLTLLRTHRLRLPRELSLLVKTIVMADGLGKQVDPGFDLASTLGPYLRRFVLRGFAPSALLRRAVALLQDVAELGADAPDVIRRALAVLERGGVDVHLRASELEPLVARAERIGNRLVAGAIAAAFIGGVGRVVAGDPDRWRPWEAPLITLGLGALGTLGGYLAVTARHRRLR